MSTTSGRSSHDASPRDTAAAGAWLAWLLVPAGLLLFAGANAHLVYVAVQSQPDCVAAHEGRGRRQRLSRRQVRVLRRGEMGETDKSYWLLSETSGIGETRDPRLAAAACRSSKASAGLRQAGGTSGPGRLPAWPTGSAYFSCRSPSYGRSWRSGATTSCFPRSPGS